MSKNLSQLASGNPPVATDLVHIRRIDGQDYKLTTLQLTAKLPVPALATAGSVNDADLLMIAQSAVVNKIVASAYRDYAISDCLTMEYMPPP
jgi:hypothetical protein